MRSPGAHAGVSLLACLLLVSSGPSPSRAAASFSLEYDGSIAAAWERADGGWRLVGTRDDSAWVFDLTSQGLAVDSRLVTTGRSDRVLAAHPTADGGLALAGSSDTLGWFAVLGPDLEPRHSVSLERLLSGLAPADEGGWFAASGKEILRLDATGQVLWSRSFPVGGTGGSTWVGGLGWAEDDDLLFGQSTDICGAGIQHPYGLIRVDARTRRDTRVTFRELRGGHVRAVAGLNDGSVVFSRDGSYLRAVTVSGRLLWERRLDDLIERLVPSAAGGYLLVGRNRILRVPSSEPPEGTACLVVTEASRSAWTEDGERRVEPLESVPSLLDSEEIAAGTLPACPGGGTDCHGLCWTGERCDDGVDDDGDGLIDCEDPDCLASEACADGDPDGDGHANGEWSCPVSVDGFQLAVLT